jgi:hypothetical protein
MCVHYCGLLRHTAWLLSRVAPHNADNVYVQALLIGLVVLLATASLIHELARWLPRAITLYGPGKVPDGLPNAGESLQEAAGLWFGRYWPGGAKNKDNAHGLDWLVTFWQLRNGMKMVFMFVLNVFYIYLTGVLLQARAAMRNV